MDRFAKNDQDNMINMVNDKDNRNGNALIIHIN